MASWITLLERERRPGVISLEPHDTPGSLFWSQMASRITLPEPEKHSRITLRSQDGSLAANRGPGGEILHTFAKLDDSRGGTAGSDPPSNARTGATEGGRGEETSPLEERSKHSDLGSTDFPSPGPGTGLTGSGSRFHAHCWHRRVWSSHLESDR